MNFFETYKKLDALCKDMYNSDKGINSYIDDMEKCYTYTDKIPYWAADLKKLKHYRYLRNSIAHEMGATEKSLCDETDTLWLEAFYQKIMNQTDPLALRRKMIEDMNKPKAVKQKQEAKPNQVKSSNVKHKNEPIEKNFDNKRSSCIVASVFVALAAFALLYFLLRYIL